VSKESGIGDQLYVRGYDLSGDVGVVNGIAATRTLLDVRGISQTAMHRIAGIAGGRIAFNAYYNPSAAQSHPILSALQTGNLEVCYFHGTTLGNVAAGLTCKQVSYDPTLGEDGSMKMAVEALGSNGTPLEWGVQLTAGKRTDSSATSPAAGVDTTTVSTAFGCAVYIQVFAFTGTSVTFVLRDSADNSAWAAVTGGSSAAITAIGTERVATSLTATIRRYLQIQTTGTFSNCVFAALAVRFPTAQS
jgi:hypothetical protein